MLGAYEKFLETAMIVTPKLVAEGVASMVGVVDVNCHLRTFVKGPADFEVEFANKNYTSTSSQIHGVMEFSDALSEASPDYLPNIRSGSFAAIGSREFMEDEHICVDDLFTQLGHLMNSRTSFYGVFDGHGGSAAATYIKKNAIKFFFEDAELPQSNTHDASFLEELANCHRKSYQHADIALSSETTVSSTCGTTALTAIVIGRHLLIANAGDCRAVLCRRGVAFDMSDDHRPTHASERRRVEECGGFIDDMDYLNGELSVTRALGDWFLKPSALICDPEVRQLVLSEEDEFLIIGCDGIWDVVPSQVAVSLVRRGLRRHDDPGLCAKELVMEAARLESNDNLTAIVVCFSEVKACEAPQGKRLLFSGMSEEALDRLKCALDAK